MNVRKRGLALLMCICMIFTLLPFSALADATAQDVVYGKYDSTGTTWTKDNSLTAENDAYKNDKTSADVKYSKEAKPVAGEADTYDITLKIESTTTKTSPGASAVVLVIDQSYSMNCCATCNNDEHNYNFVYQHAVGCKTEHTGKVDYEDTRLKAAKDAAKQFADNYATTGSERYLSVVSFCEYSKYLNFGNYFNKIYWVDVSNQKDLKTFKDKIDTIKLDSGTNLSAGLDKAYNLFNNDTVKNISSRYTVVLTDGKPNYPDNSAKAAEDSADNLKTKAKSEVYTVCVGAEDTPFDGTTVGEFLKEKIASKKTGKVYAYNIITKEQLFAAFTAIFADIQLGLSSGFTVNDPMGANIVLQSQSITDAVIDNNGFVWTPTTPSEIVAGENGAKTYIYTVTYRVKLNTSAEGFVDGKYYPTNDDTTLKFKDGKNADGSDNNVTLQFNVPGVKGKAPTYTVTYKPGDHGTLTDADNSGNVVTSGLKKGDNTPAAPEVKPHYGYYHIGWDPVIVDTVTGNATYTARYEKLNNLSYTIKHYWIGDKTQTIREDIVNSDATLGDTITVEVDDATHIDGYTIMPEQSENSTAITATSDKVIKLYYYKNVTLESKSGTFTYDGKDHSVSGYDVITKADNGKDVKVNAEFIGVSASRTEKDVGSYPVTFNIRGDVVDKEALIGKIDSNSYYIVSDVKEGTLTIEKIKDEVTVKITGNNKTVTYNGKEQSVEGYVADTNGLPITVSLATGKTAFANGTEVGTYKMNLAATDFVATSDIYGNIKIVIVEDGWLKINRRPMPPVNPGIGDEIIVEITGNSDSVVYDGAEHSVKGYTVKISDPRYTEKDFTFTGKAEASGVNAGTYEMGLKAEQFKNTNARFTNVKFVIKADGVLTITPKELTITAGSKTEYGPTPVTCGEWTVSGLAAGDKVESVKITGIQSVPGSSPNVPSDAVIKNAKGEDVTKNYAIKYVNGTLTMLEVLNKEDHFNYIIGTPEGLSLPTANVTRAEVATIFFRLMTDDARAKFDSLDNNFSDVAKGKWYNRAISTLAKAGIIKGDPAGTYRPGDPITRAEMAAIIARFGDFKEGGKTFSDISGHWAQKYIELAASNGWINGNPDGTFKPNNNITRAETVAMINRVLDRQTKDVSDLLPVSQMTNWSDNMDTAKWYYRDMQEATNNHKAERVGNSIYEKWTEKLPDIDWASYQI